MFMAGHMFHTLIIQASRAAHQASWKETSLEPCRCYVGSSLTTICFPKGFQFWWTGIFQWEPVLLLNSSPAVALDVTQQHSLHSALAAMDMLEMCWVLIQICVSERQKSRVSWGWCYLSIPLLHEHFVIVTVLSFAQSHFAALFLYHFVIKSLGKSSLPVLESAFKSQGCHQKSCKTSDESSHKGNSVCDVRKSRRIFFLNGVEQTMCQVKKSSNKLVKHPSKRASHWKKWKSNSENIPFLHIPRWERCYIFGFSSLGFWFLSKWMGNSSILSGGKKGGV